MLVPSAINLTVKSILLMQVQSMIGLPYRWGGDDYMEGFDCSGMVLELLHSVHLGPSGDTTAQGIFNYYKDISISNRAQFGSLVFFGRNEDKITHVGFALNSLEMIEAGGGSSATVSEEAARRQNAYIRIRPINRRTDLVKIVNPDWGFYEND